MIQEVEVQSICMNTTAKMRGILAIFVSTTLEAGTQITTINGLLTVFEILPQKISRFLKANIFSLQIL